MLKQRIYHNISRFLLLLDEIFYRIHGFLVGSHIHQYIEIILKRSCMRRTNLLQLDNLIDCIAASTLIIN